MANKLQQRLSQKLDPAKASEFQRFVDLYEQAEYAHLPKLILRQWLLARLGLTISERHFRRMMNSTK